MSTTAEQSTNITTATAEPRAPSLTTTIRDWFAALGLPRVRVLVESFALGVRQHLDLDPTRPHLPAPLLDALEGQDALAFSVASHERGRGLAMLGAVFALWRVGTEFSAASGWRRRVREPEREAVRERLFAFPLVPSAVIDGGPRVAACWLLTAPLDVRKELGRALVLHRQLAVRLGADVGAALDLGALLPLGGGAIREWGNDPRRFATFAELDVSRRYALEDLERTITTTTAAPAARKGARA